MTDVTTKHSDKHPDNRSDKRFDRHSGNGRPRQLEIDWASMLEQHERWLRTVVFARLREPHAVDEVMQEVALAAVRQSAPLKDPDKAAPWLYRLAIRQSLLYRRKCGRQRKLIDQYTQARPPRHQTADPLGWLLASERAAGVRTALERLADRDREILLLKYAEGWNYHRIARQLGVSHSAVEARLHRARKRLRNELTAMQLVEVPS